MASRSAPARCSATRTPSTAFPAGHFQQVPLEGVSGYFELEVSDSSLQEAVRRFSTRTRASSERAITVATGQKPKEETGRRRLQVSLKILNGNGEARLRRRGRGAPRPDRLPDRERRQRRQLRLLPHAGALRPRGRRRGRGRRRRRSRELFGDAEVEEAPGGKPLSTTLRSIVGKTFQGTLGARADRRHARAAAPRCRHRPTSLTPALRPLRKERRLPADGADRAGAGLLDRRRRGHPRLQDRRRTRRSGSRTTPGRTSTGASSRPAGTSRRSSTSRRWSGRSRGRSYKLFFSGAKLHIVAFEQNGGRLLGREHAPQ